MAFRGTSRDDEFRGTAFDEEIFGLGGDDRIFGSPGADTLNGGYDIDTVIYGEVFFPIPFTPGAVNVDLERAVQSGGFAEGDVLISIENVSGSPEDDVIAGNGEDNDLFGNGGDDILEGRDGDDVLSGDGSALFIRGPDGDDHLDGGEGNDQLFGDFANDTLIGGTGSNLLDGGAGTDTASYANAASGVTASTAVAFTQNGDTTDTLLSIENLTGSSFADRLNGSSIANVIDGGNGDDVITGGAGADVLKGGAGIDTATYIGSSSAVSINLGVLGFVNSPFGIVLTQITNGTGTGGDAQGDTLNGIENLTGSGFGDVLTGNLAANVLSGGAGADTLDGGGNNDLLEGGGGADTLIGGNGTDTLSYAGSTAAVLINLGNGQAAGGHAQGDTFTSIEILAGSSFADALFGDGLINTIDGAAGTDSLFGGLNNDTFVFAATQANGDTLIDFEGNGAGAGDQIRFVGYGAGALLQLDATHWQISSQDGAVQEIITLANAALIDASDFLFA